MAKELAKAKQLNKDLLVWADVKTLLLEKNRSLTEEELVSKVGSYEIFWKIYYEKDLKWLVAEQLDFMGKNVEGDSQLMFMRGILQGIELVRQMHEAQVNMSISRFNTDDK